MRWTRNVLPNFRLSQQPPNTPPCIATCFWNVPRPRGHTFSILHYPQSIVEFQIPRRMSRRAASNEGWLRQRACFGELKHPIRPIVGTILDYTFLCTAHLVCRLVVLSSCNQCNDFSIQPPAILSLSLFPGPSPQYRFLFWSRFRPWICIPVVQSSLSQLLLDQCELELRMMIILRRY